MLRRIGLFAALALSASALSCGPSAPLAPAMLCHDGIKDGSETGVDCGGGTCAPCDTSMTCLMDSDCVSGVCASRFCQGPTCSDGVKNGGETGVDCGGPCMPCAAGLGCALPGDCTSGVCAAMICQAPSCSDGIKNGSETDVDCGGMCAPCKIGEACRAGSDCTSTVCQSQLCVLPSCTDGIKDGGETDVDCGGMCAPCAAGLDCLLGSDCTSLVCTGDVCQKATCTDGVKNGSETATDCGGGNCPGCAIGKACLLATDCSSGNCAATLCATPDIAQNGVSRNWSDGTYALACYDYIRSSLGNLYAGATGNGRYTIDADGAGPKAPFDVYCEMTTDGGGWTLVDNDADPNSAFTERDPGANPDVTVTRGSYLPAYTWSGNPQLLCKASVFNGTAGWVTLDAQGSLALEYPTQTTPVNATYAGQWAYDNLNGNTAQGTTAWLYTGSGRFGSVWIGNGGQPTCACDYYAPSPETGLGGYQSGVAPMCSTWVR